MKLITELMLLAAILPLFFLVFDLMMMSSSSEPSSYLWSSLITVFLSAALLFLAHELSFGSHRAYMITLALVGLMMLLNIMPIIRGDLFNAVYICLEAAVLIYLLDPEVKCYFSR